MGYKIIVGSYFFQLCKSLLFATDDIIEQIFQKWYNDMNIKGKWISQNEKDERERISAEAASLQKQRDFIHY